MSSAAWAPSGSAFSSEARSSPGRPMKRRVFSAPPRHSRFGAAVGDDPAAVDDRDIVGELLGLVHEVGGEHDGDAVGAQVADQIPGGVAGLRVEAGGRLVQEDELRAADHGHREREALLLAAGEPAVGRAAAAARPRRSISASTSSGWACSLAMCRSISSARAPE